MKKIFGLDFGTSNSALALNNNGNVSLINIDPNNKKSPTTKSVIYFDEEKHNFFVGHQAVNLYIKNNAVGRYIQSVKSFLQTKDFYKTDIEGRLYDLDELIAIILRWIKTRGEEATKEEIYDVVLGRPVIFSEDGEIDSLAEDRLRQAAELAGFKNIYFQLEPIAAAISYESTLPDGEEKIVLVGDFGGGTSDFSIVKTVGGKHRGKTDRKEDVLSAGGICIAGDAFDSLIMWERLTKYFGRNVKLHTMISKITGSNERMDFPLSILIDLCKWHYIPRLNTPAMMQNIREYKYLAEDKRPIENLENLIIDNYGYILFKSIEKAKCELSTVEKAKINFKEYRWVIKKVISLENANEYKVVKEKEYRLVINEDITRTEVSPFCDY